VVLDDEAEMPNSLQQLKLQLAFWIDIELQGLVARNLTSATP
jgi:hypothetical protein